MHIKFSIICLTLIWRQKWCCFAWQHDRQLFFLLFPNLCRQKVESRTWYNSVKLPAWHCLPTIPHDQRPKTCPCLAWDPIKDKKKQEYSELVDWKYKYVDLVLSGWSHQQRYTYRVLQTIQMELILLYVLAEPAVLGSTKTALKFKYAI